MLDLSEKPKRLPTSRLFGSLLELIVRRHAAALIAVAVLTAVFAFQLPHLTFRTSINDLVVESLPETTAYQEFLDEFGTEEVIRIVIRTDDIFDPATFLLIARLSESAAGIHGVRRVVSLPEIKKAAEQLTSKIPLDEFKAIVGPAALFKRNLLSDDHRTTAITLLLKNDADKTRVIEQIRELIASAPKGIPVYQIGMPLVAEALVLYTEQDFFRLPPITLVVIFLVLVLLFRNAVSIVIPVLSVIISLIWTFGTMAWLERPISMLLMIIPVFLVAVGIAYCLHIVSEYHACARKAGSPQEAAISTFRSVSLPTLLAVATTVIGLGSLLLSRIAAINEFALFSCLGMIYFVIIVFLFIPSALAALPLPRDDGRGPMRFEPYIDRLLDLVVSLNIKHQKWTLLVLGGVGLFCAVGLVFIRVETNPVDQFRRDTPVSRHFHDIYQDLSGSFPINVVIGSGREDYFQQPANLERIGRLQAFLETLPGVDKTVSVVDYIKLVNYVTSRYVPGSYVMPEADFEIRISYNNYKTMLGEEMLTRFVTPDFSRTTILLLTHISNSADFLAVRKKILDYLKKELPPNLHYDVTGFGMVISTSSTLLTRGQIKSFGLTLFLIFLIMLMLFLSIKVGVIATIPNLFPVLVNFGLMGWLGIGLSSVTSLIASIAIGLAVDDTIHYLVHYNREFKRDLNKDRALGETIRRTGRPIILTTVAICLGFSILGFSHFKPTATFGFLMVVTMVSALIGDLLLLPSLMLHVELVTAWDLLKLMPALEGMSAGAAHELKQPLNAIRMGADYLGVMVQRKDRIPQETLARVADEIGRQVDRASDIVNRLSRFSQPAGFETEPVDVNRAITETLDMMYHQLNLENITVELELGEDLARVAGQRHRLGQVILNVLTNSMEAVRKKRSIQDETFHGTIAVRSRARTGGVSIWIEDNGIGLPDHLAGRAFEPFFTTKAPAEGKGLGLSVSNQIIQGFGGTIQIRSRDRMGTTIEIGLPEAPDA